jgi:RNA polymerase sigma-70 factor (ECF subfamily)
LVHTKHFSLDSDKEGEILQKGNWSMMQHQEKAAEEYRLAMLYQKYAKAILTYLDRRISIKEDAEDLLLEVFLAALENQVWTTMTDGNQLAWLRRVARNKLVDHYRHKTRHPVTALQEMHEILDEDENLMPEYLALRQEAQDILYRKIATLPHLQQEILRLRFAQGLHTKEIALRLNKTDTAIRILLSRTLNQLRRSYDQQHRGV